MRKQKRLQIKVFQNKQMKVVRPQSTLLSKSVAVSPKKHKQDVISNQTKNSQIKESDRQNRAHLAQSVDSSGLGTFKSSALEQMQFRVSNQNLKKARFAKSNYVANLLEAKNIRSTDQLIKQAMSVSSSVERGGSRDSRKQRDRRQKGTGTPAELYHDFFITKIQKKQVKPFLNKKNRQSSPKLNMPKSLSKKKFQKANHHNESKKQLNPQTRKIQDNFDGQKSQINILAINRAPSLNILLPNPKSTSSLDRGNESDRKRRFQTIDRNSRMREIIENPLRSSVQSTVRYNEARNKMISLQRKMDNTNKSYGTGIDKMKNIKSQMVSARIKRSLQQAKKNKTKNSKHRRDGYTNNPEISSQILPEQTRSGRNFNNDHNAVDSDAYVHVNEIYTLQSNQKIYQSSLGSAEEFFSLEAKKLMLQHHQLGKMANSEDQDSPTNMLEMRHGRSTTPAEAYNGQIQYHKEGVPRLNQESKQNSSASSIENAAPMVDYQQVYENNKWEQCDQPTEINLSFPLQVDLQTPEEIMNDPPSPEQIIEFENIPLQIKFVNPYHPNAVSKDTFLSGGQKSGQTSKNQKSGDNSRGQPDIQKAYASMKDIKGPPATRNLAQELNNRETFGPSLINQEPEEVKEILTKRQITSFIEVHKQLKIKTIDEEQKDAKPQKQKTIEIMDLDQKSPKKHSRSLNITDQLRKDKESSHSLSSSYIESEQSEKEEAIIEDIQEDAESDKEGQSKLLRLQVLWNQFLLKPSSPFKIKWDVLIILLSVWNSIGIPLQFAFPQALENSSVSYVSDRFIDILFIIDIFINFRSCYIDPKTDILIEDPIQISKNYMAGRFWIDLMASIPFELFTFIASSDQVQLFGMLKLVRLMRLGRMVTFLKANKSFKLSIILVQLLFILLLVTHWIACLWLIICDLDKTWEPPKDVDWDFTDAYSESSSTRYNIFFYYSVLTLVSNELMPTSFVEIMIAIIILLIGSITIGVLIGEFSSILNDMGEKAQKINEQFDMISNVMIGVRLPEEIQMNVVNYYDRLMTSKFVHNELVYEYLNQIITKSIKMFQVEDMLLDSKLISDSNVGLLKHFASLFKIEFFPENEIILKQNDIPDNFFLICEGIVEVSQEKIDFIYFDYVKKTKFMEDQIKRSFRRRQNKGNGGKEEKRTNSFTILKSIYGIKEEVKEPDEEDLDDNGYQIINDLKEGMYFGEVSLLTNLRRTSTIYSVTPCFLGVIDKETFMKVVDDNMDLKYSLIHRISEYKDEVFKTLITMVKNTPAFRPLSTQIVRKIVYKLKQIRFSNKQLILRTGEYSDKIFFVMKGRVSVMVKDIDDESASQERLILLKHGCSFNFMGALMERPAIFDYVCGTLDQVYNPEAQDVFSSNQSPNNDASSPKNDPLSFEGGQEQNRRKSKRASRRESHKSLISQGKKEGYSSKHAEIFYLSKADLLELEAHDENIFNALEGARGQYLGKHIKYDYSPLLYRNLKELGEAQNAKTFMENNKYFQVSPSLYIPSNIISFIKLSIIRKKIRELSRFMIDHTIDLQDFRIFQLVDKNYLKFVGKDKNLPLALILNNGQYNIQTQEKLFQFLKSLEVKNKMKETQLIQLSQEDQSRASDLKIYQDMLSKKAKKALKETGATFNEMAVLGKSHLNANTVMRYKQQEHFKQLLTNTPAKALQMILDQSVQQDTIIQNAKEISNKLLDKKLKYVKIFKEKLLEMSPVQVVRNQMKAQVMKDLTVQPSNIIIGYQQLGSMNVDSQEPMNIDSRTFLGESIPLENQKPRLIQKRRESEDVLGRHINEIFKPNELDSMIENFQSAIPSKDKPESLRNESGRLESVVRSEHKVMDQQAVLNFTSLLHDSVHMSAKNRQKSQMVTKTVPFITNKNQTLPVSKKVTQMDEQQFDSQQSSHARRNQNHLNMFYRSNNSSIQSAGKSIMSMANSDRMSSIKRKDDSI